MQPSKDPYALLPIAVAGIVVGGMLVYGCITLARSTWAAYGTDSSNARYARLEGTVESATWRRSARAGGPRWYLQVKIDGDPRRFIVAARSVDESLQSQFGSPSAKPPSISALEGQSATIVVDSTLRESPSVPTPYMLGLRLGDQWIVHVEQSEVETPSPWLSAGLMLSYGLGTIIGIGILGGSLHHVYVCVRHYRR